MAWKGLLLVWLPCFPRCPAAAPSPLLLVVCVLPLSAARTGMPLHPIWHPIIRSVLPPGDEPPFEIRYLHTAKHQAWHATITDTQRANPPHKWNVCRVHQG